MNVNGGAVVTLNLKLDCPGPPGFGDFSFRVPVTSKGGFSGSGSGAGSARPVRLTIAGNADGRTIRGRLTARVGSCAVGPSGSR